MAKGLIRGGESTSHDSGNDILYTVKETGQQVLIEGDEYHLCKAALMSDEIHEFKNKTNKEILDDIYTRSSCMVKEGEANVGDFIVCKLAVRDKKKRNLTGTISEIISVMQAEKGCRVVDGAEYEKMKNGGSVLNENLESLISKGIVELKFYDTTPEHAKQYGIQAKKPLYVQNLCVSEKALNHLEDYARKNGNDVIFGYVAEKASFTKDSRQSFFCDVDMIKNWLHNNGYAINAENNDFHKVVRFADGGYVENPNFNPYSYSYDLILISEIEKYKEFDREVEKKWGSIDDTLEKLTEDIKVNGIIEPIVLQIDLDSNGLIVEGNTRLAAAKRLGFDKIPVRVIYKEFGSINKHKAKKLPQEGFTKIEKYKKGGGLTNKDKKDIYIEWKSLVNMSVSELKEFYDSEEGKNAGLSKEMADKLGIKSGRESAEWIIKMKQIPYTKWTDEMWDWAKRQIRFIKRMKGIHGDLYKNKDKTRKHTALLIWGHNPEK